MMVKKSTFIAFLAVCFLALGLCIFALSNYEHKEEETRYNNGICLECGGHLEQTGHWTDRADGTVFNVFHCDKCSDRYLFRFFGE